MAVTMKSAIFRNVMPHSPIEVYRCFRETLVKLYHTTWCNIPEESTFHILSNLYILNFLSVCIRTVKSGSLILIVYSFSIGL
jgi:hypothetical protein